MITVRFAYHQTYEYRYESLAGNNKEWFGFICSYKDKLKAKDNCEMFEL